MTEDKQFTATAYRDRTSLPCASLSFRDIAEGGFPDVISIPTSPPTIQMIASEENPMVEMVVCSFALHLVETSSELFALLWELSTKARWLVLLSPHKKPEVSLKSPSRRHANGRSRSKKDGVG
jgi:cell division inhibitor SulA